MRVSGPLENWARPRRRTLASRSRREANGVSQDRHAEATQRRDATHVPPALRVGAALGRLWRCDFLTMRSVASPSSPRLASGHPALPTRPDPVLQRATCILPCLAPRFLSNRDCSNICVSSIRKPDHFGQRSPNRTQSIPRTCIMESANPMDGHIGERERGGAVDLGARLNRPVRLGLHGAIASGCR